MTAGLEREIEDLTRGLSELGIAPSRTALGRFRAYLELIEHTRGRLHLISRRDHGRVARRHFLPSMLALDHAAGRRRGADLGPGAGFPSVPIKIVRPELDLTLIESVGKKARFLEDLRAVLDLEGCEVVNGRAEAYPGPAFDLLFLKAAGPIRDWVPCVGRLLAPAGRAVFFKTPGRVGPEIAAARTRLERAGLGWTVQERRTPLEGRSLALVVLERSGPAGVVSGNEGPLDGFR